MTVPQENQAQPQEAPKSNDKEYNFAQVRKQLDQERQARLQAEEERAQLKKQLEERTRGPKDDDDDDDEPYVDKKKLDRKLSMFERQLEEKIEKKAEEKARSLIEKSKQESWVKNNPDFYEVLNHAQTFAEKYPELAEDILEMPEGFERQKLVYRNIKAMGVHKPAEKQPSIQEKVDANRRSPYYQPSGVGTAPYASNGDFSQVGQKNAYAKMKELQARLRMG